MQNKARLELADYEAENLAKLQKLLSRKWEFIYMQAEAQIKVDKKRDKMERKILDSQERAFWDVHRPAPGCVNTIEVDIRKTMRTRRKDHPHIGFFRSTKNKSSQSNASSSLATTSFANNNNNNTISAFPHSINTLAITQPSTSIALQQLNPYLNKKITENEEIIALDNLRKEKDFLKRRLERRYVKSSKVSERFILS
jgi:hypothetical protein